MPGVVVSESAPAAEYPRSYFHDLRLVIVLLAWLASRRGWAGIGGGYGGYSRGGDHLLRGWGRRRFTRLMAEGASEAAHSVAPAPVCRAPVPAPVPAAAGPAARRRPIIPVPSAGASEAPWHETFRDLGHPARGALRRLRPAGQSLEGGGRQSGCPPGDPPFTPLTTSWVIDNARILGAGTIQAGDALCQRLKQDGIAEVVVLVQNGVKHPEDYATHYGRWLGLGRRRPRRKAARTGWFG